MYGLYFLGLKWMHRRSSHTIDGVGRDAEYVGDHLSAEAAFDGTGRRPELWNELRILHSLLGSL